MVEQLNDRFADGTPVEVVAAEAVRAPEAAVDASNRPDALWPRPKALCLISAFKLFQNQHSRRQYTKRAMWEDLAAQVNEEFPGSGFTPAQIENKWRTMERAWNRARTANRRTGAARQTCEYER